MIGTRIRKDRRRLRVLYGPASPRTHRPCLQALSEDAFNAEALKLDAEAALVAS